MGLLPLDEDDSRLPEHETIQHLGTLETPNSHGSGISLDSWRREVYPEASGNGLYFPRGKSIGQVFDKVLLPTLAKDDPVDGE